ncbi:MAG TPA: porin [Polyangiaceae bacterium]|nr:porin [Polyangiaceae bacterium]
MRRLSLASGFWAMATAVAISATSGKAHADINLYDKDGWGFYTRGLIAAHYQYITGDGDPSTTHGVLVAGKFNQNVSHDPRDNTLKLSRVHSGFIGTQIGFGITREINDQMRIDSLMAVSLVDISNDRRAYAPKQVDFRESWAALIGPAGTFKFGRMFSIFGSASAPVVTMAYEYGVGNPCIVEGAAIACASVGAGPIYAGFDAQFRYISPRFAGLELQAAVSDPVGGRTFRLTPKPRLDGEINFDKNFTKSMRLRLIGQAMWEEVERIFNNAQQKRSVWGVMGAAIFDVGGFGIGGGYWTGAGIGPRTILENDTNDFGFDSTGKMRQFTGLFGNLSYEFKSRTKIAAGGGQLNVASTDADKLPATGVDVMSQAQEYHFTVSQKVDALTFIVEFMRWKTTWYWGEKADLQFLGGGVNFNW